MQGGERGREAVQGLGALLFHLFHFRQSGETLIALDREEAKRLVAMDVEGGWREWGGELPSVAGYLQLPLRLFWSSQDALSGSHASSGSSEEVSEEANSPAPGRAEAIDGIFWTSSTGGTLSLAVISGIVEGRPGFTIFDLPSVPLADARRWPEIRARDEGVDFATTLPGGDLSGLHSILSLGEVLKLLSRAFGARAKERIGQSEVDDAIADRDAR
jgi:hypothetical protein